MLSQQCFNRANMKKKIFFKIFIFSKEEQKEEWDEKSNLKNPSCIKSVCIHETHAFFLRQVFTYVNYVYLLSWEIGYYFSLFKIIGFSLLIISQRKRTFSPISGLAGVFFSLFYVFIYTFYIFYSRLTINRVELELWLKFVY